MAKAIDIYFQLYNRIMTGEWEPGTRLPTEPELAKSLGIARKTLRSALLRLEKDGLLNRYPRLGTYVRKLERQSAKRILLIMSDTTRHPFFNPIWVVLPGIIECCHARGIECDRLDIGMVEESLPIAQQYCGIILTDATYIGLEEKIAILKKTKLPIVLYSSFEQNARDLQIAAVITDRNRAFFDGLDHLIRHGHRRICFILNRDWDDMQARTGVTKKSLIHYLKSHDIEFRNCRFLFLQDWIRHSLFGQDMEKVRTVLMEPECPTAFYCYTDYIAFQIKQILDSMKLRVPEDVALMGFSGFLHSSLVRDLLSTVDFCYGRIAKLAVDLLLAHEHWKHRDPPPIYYVPHEVIPRKSTDRCLLFEWEQISSSARESVQPNNRKTRKKKYNEPNSCGN